MTRIAIWTALCLIIPIVIVAGCYDLKYQSQASLMTGGPHAFKCEDVGTLNFPQRAYRCENEEVICYTYANQSISCYPKDRP